MSDWAEPGDGDAGGASRGERVFELMVQVATVNATGATDFETLTSDSRGELARLLSDVEASSEADVVAVFTEFRTAVMSHLNVCESLRPRQQLYTALSAEEVAALRERSAFMRLDAYSLGDEEAEIDRALAALLDAQARIGEALWTSSGPGVVLFDGGAA